MKYTIEGLKTGQVYSRGDDAVYYCVMVSLDWSLMLHYSINHHVCNAEFWNQEELDQDYNVDSLREDDESGYWKDFFESELKFYDWQTIKE